MQLADLMIQFFGFDLISQSGTFVDLLSCILKVGTGIWLTLFICRSLFLVIRAPELRF